MTPAEVVLGQLRNVRQRGAGQWFASCPTGAHPHGDRSRGLSIRETSGGAVLLHCFGGCAVGEVVAALGLDLAALFPPRDPERAAAGGAPNRPRIDWRGAMDAMATDLHALVLVFNDVARGVTFTPAEASEIKLIAARLACTVEALTGGQY